MSLELTEQQLRALDVLTEDPPRLIDPRTNAAYYLIAASDYEAIRDLLEEERREKAIRSVGLRNAAGRLGESP